MLRKLSSQYVSRSCTSSAVRSFTINHVLNAKAKGNVKGAKPTKQVAPSFKPKTASSQDRPKKSGMTHLGFRDAVRELGLDKLAVDLESLNVNSLTFDSPAQTITKYSKKTEESLRVLDSFKKYQYHEAFKNPISLITRNTINIRDQFINNLEQPSKSNRICIIGEKGSGKSTLITQSKALALSKHRNDVILLHLDHAEKLVNGTSDYIYNKKLELYQQPMFTKRWILKLRTANKAIFKKLTLSRDISFTTNKKEYHYKKNENTINDLLLNNHDFGKSGPSGTFQFLIEELIHHSNKVPVLLSIDNVNALTGEPYTKYFHQDYTPIRFTEFEVGKFINDTISGKISFNKGGVLLSESTDCPASKTLPTGLGLINYDPYWKTKDCDVRVAESFLSNGGVKPFKVENFTKDETRELLNFYSESGTLQIRQYPTKDDGKSSEDIINERKNSASLYASSNPEQTFDPKAQFEKIVNNSFTVSSGNPGFIAQSANLSY